MVLELRAEMAIIKHYKRGNPDLIVVPGQPGALLPGISVKALHWNRRFVMNYKALHEPKVREEIRLRGGVSVMCCGLGRQRNDFQSCGDCHTSEFVEVGNTACCKRCSVLWKQH